MMSSLTHAAFLVAYDEALIAYEQNEVPVGACIAYNGEIIARSHNQVRQLKNSTAHAELLVINEASKILNSEKLTDSDLYTTLEPCTMCSGAAILARVKSVQTLALETKIPAFRSISMSGSHNHFPFFIHHSDNTFEYETLLKKFFKEKRSI